MVGGGWCLNPTLVFSLSLSQAEQLGLGQYQVNLPGVLCALLINVSYPCSTIHIYEPVPAFSAVLSQVWAEYSSKLGYRATVHHYGLGSGNR